MSSIKKVLFIGAGGNIGGPVFKYFAKSEFDITVLSRPTSTKTFDSNVKVIKRDYSDPSLHEAFEGQDAVVCLVGGTGILDQIKLIDASVKAGVKRFIPSEFGSNTLNPKTQEVIFFYKQKLAILDHLKAVSAKTPSFSWTGICTGPIFDWCLVTDFLGFELKANRALIYDFGDTRISATNIEATALALLGVLRDPAATANKYLYVASVTTSQNEILASLEKATEKTWEVTKASTAAAGLEGGAKLAKGDFTGIRPVLHRLMYGGDAGGNFEETPEGLANELLKLPKENLDDIIKDVLAGKIP